MDRFGIKLTSRDGSDVTSPQPTPKETVLYYNTFLSLKMEWHLVTIRKIYKTSVNRKLVQCVHISVRDDVTER